MIRLKDIRLAYQSFELEVSNFQILPGELYVVVGPNGSGKTSFLNLLALLDKPSQGKVFLNGEDVWIKDSMQFLRDRRRISYLLQNPYLFSMNVFDNAALGLRFRRVPENMVHSRVDKILKYLALTHLSHRKIDTLSGGEAQRAALARALIIDADLYILDEPTANVDHENIRLVEEVILSLNKERGASVIISTHSREQAYRMSDHLISIINGQIKNLPYENVFSGKLKAEKGLKILQLAETVQLKLSTSAEEHVTVAIDPNDILLSKVPVSSSALNSFRGVIHKVEAYNGSLQVFVNTGVSFCALITQHSFHELGLNIGKNVWVTFKANSVKVI